MQHFYNPNDDEKKQGILALQLFGDLIIAIRNDLGHKKFTDIMKWYDIARMWITDIDQYLPPEDRKQRGTHSLPKPIFDNSENRDVGSSS